MNQKSTMVYTFRVYGKDGKWHYPQKHLGPGAIDFKWTKKIENAITWDTQETTETVAIEFFNCELIGILNGPTKIYHIIKHIM